MFITFVFFVTILFVFFVDKMSVPVTIFHTQSRRISNTLWILTILTNTCARIQTKTFFSRIIIFTFTLTCFIIPFLIWITCCTIELAFTVKWNMISCYFTFFVCSHIKCFKVYDFCFFGTHIFGEKKLKIPAHLFKLIIKG